MGLEPVKPLPAPGLLLLIKSFVPLIVGVEPPTWLATKSLVAVRSTGPGCRR